MTLASEPMRIPGWFFAVIAACAVAATATYAIHTLRPEHDWQRDSDDVGAFDKKTATWCYYNRNNGLYYCSDLKDGRRMVLRH